MQSDARLHKEVKMKVQITNRLEESDIYKLRQIADKNKRSLNFLIESIIKNYLENDIDVENIEK